MLVPTFRQWVAMTDILEMASVFLIMSAGMTVVLMAGCLSLSVGSIFALVSVVAGQLLIHGAPWPVLILGGLLAGVQQSVLTVSVFCTRMEDVIFLTTLGLAGHRPVWCLWVACPP